MAKFVLTNPDIDLRGHVDCYCCRQPIFLMQPYTVHEYTGPNRAFAFTLCEKCEPILGPDFERIFQTWRERDAAP